MAKIKFGMMMTDARGKLGGHVFSKNRSGAYVRTKVTPVNPQTSAQSAVRSVLAVISAGWSSLTVEQRQSFNSAVEDWQTTDIFGDLKKPTGKNLYTKLNLNLSASGQSLISSAPDKQEFLALENASFTINSTTNIFTFNSFPPLSDAVYVLEFTPQLSQGTTFAKNRFRKIYVAMDISANAPSIQSAYEARFGNALASHNIQLRIKQVGANGQSTAPLILKMQPSA